MIPEGEPVAEKKQRVGLHGPGVDRLDGVEGELTAASGRAGDGVEVRGVERAELAVQVAGMVQDHHPIGRARPDAPDQFGPVVGLVSGGGLGGGEREGVEVAAAGRDLIADDRRECVGHARQRGGRPEVGQVIVIGGDRELDTLSRQGDDALLDGGVAVPAMGERVHVRVAGHQARCGDLAADRQRDGHDAPGLDVDFAPGQAVRKAAGGVDGVPAGTEAQPGLAAGGVDHAGADGLVRVRGREQGASAPCSSTTVIRQGRGTGESGSRTWTSRNASPSTRQPASGRV